MATNGAPLQWAAQGAVLNAFATREGRPAVDLSTLLDEQYLKRLGPAFTKDRLLPTNPNPAEWRFHCRRHMVRLLGWSEFGERREFPNDVNAALYARWYSPPATRKGFRRA